MVRRLSRNLYLEPRGCREWGATGTDLGGCSPTLALSVREPRTQIKVGTGPLRVPGHWGTPSPGCECSAGQGTCGLLKGVPRDIRPPVATQERDGAARKLFPPTKIAGLSPNQTRMHRLEGAQKPFVLAFPVVSPNFCRLEPCSCSPGYDSLFYLLESVY